MRSGRQGGRRGGRKGGGRGVREIERVSMRWGRDMNEEKRRAECGAHEDSLLNLAKRHSQELARRVGRQGTSDGLLGGGCGRCEIHGHPFAG